MSDDTKQAAGVPVVFHYTVGNKLEAILESGELRPTGAHIDTGERPVVWFTKCPEWDNTANKSVGTRDGEIVHLDRAGTHLLAGGLVRFLVPEQAAPHDWRAFVRKSGVSKQTARRLAEVARKRGVDPADWRVSFEPVPMAEWARIEAWDETSGTWIPHPGIVRA